MSQSSLRDAKQENEQVEHSGFTPSSTQKQSIKDENGSGLDVIVNINERNLLWKIDLRIIPWLSLYYLVSFLDRGSIGNAKVGDICFDS